MSTTKQKRKINFENDDNDNRKKRAKTDKSSAAPLWTVEELLAEQQNLSANVSKNVIKLFDEGNTIPFIIRYRRNLIGGIDNEITPEILRNIKENYDEIVSLKNKITNITKTLKKSNLLTENLEKSITSARSIEELEYIYAPFKPENKRSLAQRAKELGLEQPALDLLNNPKVNVNLTKFIRQDNKDLSNLESVQIGIVHIIAAIISTDTELLTLMRELRSQGNFRLKSKKNTKQSDNYQFDNYSDFEISIKYIKPHQILAINRGENLKVLSVKIQIPDYISNEYERFCRMKWLDSNSSKQRVTIIDQSIRDCYQRLIQPLLIRETRKDLKIKAEQASYEVFSKNLKQLLLLPPLKIQQCLLAVDPGYKNGCKLAVISPIGQLLHYCVIYPLKENNNDKKDIEKFKQILDKFECKLIILGNGKGCRQFEEWLTKLINKKLVQLQYLIVNEDGASIYSCSQEAKNEFPDLDPNIISSVSLGRRAQDPLAELVKIEPKHLGIGMYQHDLKTKKLEELLNEVVIECVSFVGVDINTASKCLLKHIAGLSDKRAEQIISYRNENGAFSNRQELLKVPGIGKKIFQQCAGFLRINPSVENNSKITRFDCTDIHPESYDVAEKLLKKLKLSPNNIGKSQFIESIKNKKSQLNLNQLSDEFNCNLETLELIFDCLSKPLNYDLRDDLTDIKPLFKTGVTNINDLKIGDLLNGRIINVTHFGYFTDIGVGTNGLIHVSKTNGLNLSIGNNVEVKVLNIEINKGRIQLEAKKIL